MTFTDDLQVPGQVFHEIKYYEDVYYYDDSDDLFDGVLGLAIEESWPPRFDQNILPSPFKTMIDNNLLSTNMFSVVWPTEEREQGTLTFGGYDEDLLDGELISHSLFPANTTKWEVEIEGLTMTDRNNSKSILVDKDLPEVRAFFMSNSIIALTSISAKAYSNIWTLGSVHAIAIAS